MTPGTYLDEDGVHEAAGDGFGLASILTKTSVCSVFGLD
jgi:hypothetical protein